MPLAPHQLDILNREGSFRGLQTLSRQGVPASEIRAMVVRVFKAIQVDIAEARKELSHLQTALGAMENACRAGATNPSATERCGKRSSHPGVRRRGIK